MFCVLIGILLKDTAKVLPLEMHQHLLHNGLLINALKTRPHMHLNEIENKMQAAKNTIVLLLKHFFNFNSAKRKQKNWKSRTMEK